MKKVEEILATHFPSHVAEAVDAEIRRRFPVQLDARATCWLRPASRTSDRRAAGRLAG